jgi:uncharacterized protein GlcG (DUF336 family)
MTSTRSRARTRARHRSRTHPRLTAVGGGYPLGERGALIGAIGISGGHYSEDQQLAERAIAQLGLGPAEQQPWAATSGTQCVRAPCAAPGP